MLVAAIARVRWGVFALAATGIAINLSTAGASAGEGRDRSPGAPATSAPPPVVPADPKAIFDAIRRPGATAVLVNVWATWCDPCREEMPRLVKFFRDHRGQGLRLVLVSADDEVERDHVARFLAEQGVDVPSWLKRGDDMAFIDGLDRRWTGALPASFLFDGAGQVRELWQGPVTLPELERAWSRVATPAARPPSSSEHPEKPRRHP